MKMHHILKTFKGSNDGLVTIGFEAGTVSALSDELAGIAIREGWATPMEPDTLLDGPHVELILELDAPDTLVDAHPDLRETKVDAPDEFKTVKLLKKMSKAEIVAYAMSHGLELVPDSMSVKDMIEAIVGAGKAK